MSGSRIKLIDGYELADRLLSDAITDDQRRQANMIAKVIEEMPSANERTETLACDLISRQAAINAVGFYSLHSGDKLLFADKPLKELPSAQPEQRWIPFHNAAPIEGQQILSCSEDGVMWMTAYNSRSNFTGAWMPLPEPYREDEE